MHRVCFLMLQKAIGRFLDLNIIFDSLLHHKFYLSRVKVEFFMTHVKALGVMIDDDCLHTVDEKWDATKNWPTPRSAKDILKFMGTIGWMSDHSPSINEIAVPMIHLTGKVNFVWLPACELAFTILKSLVPQALKPLDLSNIDAGNKHFFLVTDASICVAPAFVELACHQAHLAANYQGFRKMRVFAHKLFWATMDRVVQRYCYLASQLFFSQVVRHFGLPANIVTDRDPMFRLAFWRALALHASIGPKMSTSAHPQTDGQAESTNRSVGQILHILCKDLPDNWLLQLVVCELALNASTLASMTLALFEVVHSFIPPLSLSFGGAASGDVSTEGFAELVRLNALCVTGAMISARVCMTHQENRHHRDDTGLFAVSNKVYISASLVKFLPATASKFLPK
ncbi:hypothetical protein JCM3770_002756 [Rhodotorula araucariae]